MQRPEIIFRPLQNLKRNFRPIERRQKAIRLARMVQKPAVHCYLAPRVRHPIPRGGIGPQPMAVKIKHVFKELCAFFQAIEKLRRTFDQLKVAPVSFIKAFKSRFQKALAGKLKIKNLLAV